MLKRLRKWLIDAFNPATTTVENRLGGPVEVHFSEAAEQLIAHAERIPSEYGYFISGSNVIGIEVNYSEEGTSIYIRTKNDKTGSAIRGRR